MAERVNSAIRRLADDEPAFYIGSHAGAGLTFEAGVAMADTWADYIDSWRRACESAPAPGAQGTGDRTRGDMASVIV